MSSRRWIEDERYRAELEAKIATGKFFISTYSDCLPGRVIRVIYAGYKMLSPDNQEQTVNLIQDTTVREINEEEYQQLVINWQKAKDKAEVLAREKTEAREKYLTMQKNCLHESIERIQVVKVAGCDIYDTICKGCGKALQRSWSTAYDSDPKDHITDWNWYVRYCAQNYNPSFHPKMEDYEIVECISETFEEWWKKSSQMK